MAATSRSLSFFSTSFWIVVRTVGVAVDVGDVVLPGLLLQGVLELLAERVGDEPSSSPLEV